MCCVIEYGDGRYVVSQRRVRVRVTVHVTTDMSKLLSIRQRELRQKNEPNVGQEICVDDVSSLF